MGSSFDTLTKIYSELKICELSRLDSLHHLEIDLLLAGIGILFIAFLTLSAYLIFIDKHLNWIWEILRIRALNSFFELKEHIELRIAQVHERDEIIEYDFNPSTLKDKKPLKFRHSLGIILRLLIIFALAAFFILLQCFLLESNLQNSLWYLPTLTSSAMTIKVLAARITYYVLESKNTGARPDSLNILYPFYNTITDPNTNLLQIYNELHVLINDMRDTSIKSLFSSELQGYIYYSYPSNSTFLLAGTLNALEYFADESLNYGSNFRRSSIDTTSYIYYKESQVLYNTMDITTGMMISDLEGLINSQLNKLYYFTGSFGILFLLSYLFYYYPLLAFEIKFLEELTDFIQIIPRNSHTVFKSFGQANTHFSS